MSENFCRARKIFFLKCPKKILCEIFFQQFWKFSNSKQSRLSKDHLCIVKFWQVFTSIDKSPGDGEGGVDPFSVWTLPQPAASWRWGRFLARFYRFSHLPGGRELHQMGPGADWRNIEQKRSEDGAYWQSPTWPPSWAWCWESRTGRAPPPGSRQRPVTSVWKQAGNKILAISFWIL